MDISGIDTTSTSMCALLAVLATHPEIQKKIQDEIDTVLGENTPQLKDRPGLPYLEAAILEIVRFMSHIPLSIPHQAMCDTSILGHKVPKNTVVSVYTSPGNVQY